MATQRMRDGVMHWLDERYGVRALSDQLLTGKLVPLSATGSLYCLGGLAFFTILLQLGTGVLLLMYYEPTTTGAYQSVEFVRNDVPFGWLVQSLHAYGATVLVVLVLGHLLRVVYHQVYKRPRELHWVSGVLLLLLVLGMSFTGYLLPWTQISYWAATVGTEVPRATPGIGDWLVHFVRGSDSISEVTLRRFFMVHVGLAPAVLLGTLMMHFVMIRRTGISRPL